MNASVWPAADRRSRTGRRCSKIARRRTEAIRSPISRSRRQRLSKRSRETPADIVLLEPGSAAVTTRPTSLKSPALTAITPVSITICNSWATHWRRLLGKGRHTETRRRLRNRRPNGYSTACDRRRALGPGAPLHRMDVEWTGSREAEHLVFDGVRRFPLPGCRGSHQIANAGLAIACIDKLDEFKVGDDAIAQGLRHVDWPARVQRLTSGPLIADLAGRLGIVARRRPQRRGRRNAGRGRVGLGRGPAVPRLRDARQQRACRVLAPACRPDRGTARDCHSRRRRELVCRRGHRGQEPRHRRHTCGRRRCGDRGDFRECYRTRPNPNLRLALSCWASPRRQCLERIFAPQDHRALARQHAAVAVGEGEVHVVLLAIAAHALNLTRRFDQDEQSVHARVTVRQPAARCVDRKLAAGCDPAAGDEGAAFALLAMRLPRTG